MLLYERLINKVKKTFLKHWQGHGYHSLALPLLTTIHKSLETGKQML